MRNPATETQVAIIGAGIIGAAVAREFSKYKVNICLIEKEPDFGFGITKGSQGVLHSPLGLLLSRIVKWFQSDLDFESYLSRSLALKEKLDLDGLEMCRKLGPALDAKLNWAGRVVVAENEKEMQKLKIMKEIAEKNMNAKGLRFLDRKELEEKEPLIDSRFVGALWDPNEGVIFPTQWARAYAENARDNGTNILLETAVTGIEEKSDYWVINTSNGSIKTEVVVNAAGLNADDISAMIGKRDFSWNLIKTQLLILENRNYIKHIVCGIHKPNACRSLVPTTDGKILVSSGLGPSNNKYDLSTDKETIDLLSGYPNHFIPSVSVKRDIISNFASYMNFSTRNLDDYTLGCPRKRFINMIVCPPGLSPAPALAKEVVRMAAEEGLDLVKKNDFNPYRRKEPSLMELSSEDRNLKIQSDPKYGHIICRCEIVSEQEIVDAVRKGIRTLDGMKYETRAGMGRCQGGFCSSRVLGIMASELEASPLEIRKKGGNSYILKSETKKLREEPCGREKNDHTAS
jgi:glycerol-3-phosphate dehydrogenase